MPDVIDSLDGARALVDQLAATVPPLPQIRTKVGRDGWVPTFDDDMLDRLSEIDRAKSAAISFLLEAVGWNTDLLERLTESPGLTNTADNIAGGSWVHALHAAQDPRVGNDDDESPGETLAVWALVGNQVPGHLWRECDRDVALELLPFVAARMRAFPDDYLCQHPRNEVDARLWLLTFEPTMIDRRVTR